MSAWHLTASFTSSVYLVCSGTLQATAQLFSAPFQNGCVRIYGLQPPEVIMSVQHNSFSTFPFWQSGAASGIAICKSNEGWFSLFGGCTGLSFVYCPVAPNCTGAPEDSEQGAVVGCRSECCTLERAETMHGQG